jgi:hypothetical protein
MQASTTAVPVTWIIATWTALIVLSNCILESRSSLAIETLGKMVAGANLRF